MVFSSLTTEFMYYLLVISTHVSSSIIMIISLPDIMVKTKYWNQFTTDISSLASMLMYNNSASPVLLVCNLSHNIISLTNLSNNFLFLNDHGIPFLQTLLRKFHYPLDLILSWSQSTSLPSKQSLFLPTTLSHSQTQHICLFFMCSPNMVFLPTLPLAETQSLY